MKQDDLFVLAPDTVADVAFDDAVTELFPDMIKHSVPGYEDNIMMLGVLAGQYTQENTCVYDIGSSLGAATLSVHHQARGLSLKYICIDRSELMIKRCRSILQRHIPEADITLICDDIQNIQIENASVVLLHFTLQFLPHDTRLALLRHIQQGLKPGGVLIFSEKLSYGDEQLNQQLVDWHHAFKRAKGYSELEISEKYAAIENGQILDTLQEHQQCLKDAGFSHVHQWFQAFNFSSLIAIKD